METSQYSKSLLRPRNNSYSAEEIVAEYGSLAAFMVAMGPKTPLKIPDLGFTEAENWRMDEVLEQERQATADGL